MASCLWLCHRMTDGLQFFKPWPGIKFWRESFGHAGATVRSAARTSLFQSLWWLEREGRFGAWPAFALACSRPRYCCCRCLPRSPCVPPFIHSCFQSLPKGSLPEVHFAKAWGGTMWWWWGALGVCVGAEVILAALARDWSCSQSCAQTAFNAWGGM